MTEKVCDVCCENFNKTSRKKIECLYCNFEACKTCCKKYILDSLNDPTCMKCKKLWNDEFLLNSISKTFLKDEYKIHREIVLFDREKSLMPATQEFVEYMKRYGTVWSKGAFNDPRLQVVYEDAWKFVKYGFKFDAVIIDLTDPDLKADCWIYLLREVLKSVRESKGGFTMNAGLYMPWDTKKLHEIVTMIREICHMNPDFKYYIYTAFIPSFNGEWTFITVLHKSTFMMEPEFMDILPLQIRRSFRTLPDSLIYSDTFPLVPVLNPLN